MTEKTRKNKFRVGASFQFFPEKSSFMLAIQKFHQIKKIDVHYASFNIFVLYNEDRINKNSKKAILKSKNNEK